MWEIDSIRQVYNFLVTVNICDSNVVPAETPFDKTCAEYILVIR